MTLPANALEVHDIAISESNQFNRTGGVDLVKTVVFYIGDHGPFTLQYKGGEGTPDKINSDINGKVREIRLVLDTPHAGAP